MTNQFPHPVPAWRNYQRPGFHSCKTTKPIFYSGSWPRDALVQATLDPSIQSITQADPPDGLDDVELTLNVARGAARELHAYCRNSNGQLSIHQGYRRAIAIPRFKVMQPSVLLVARIIWKRRTYPVDAATALTIKNELIANGGNMTLLQLAETAPGDRSHITNCALSLVCRGRLCLPVVKVLNEQTRLFLPDKPSLHGSDYVAIS